MIASNPTEPDPNGFADNGSAANAAPPVAQHIFISYSQVDTDFMQALRKHLAPLEQAKMVSIWADDCIRVSEKWSEALYGAIERTNIALLLLSADFFASEFIQQRELPALHARADQGLKLIPIIIRDIDWYSSALAEFQAPLQAQPIGTPDNDAAWVKVASEVRKLCEAAQPGAPQAQIERPAPPTPVSFASSPPSLLLTPANAAAPNNGIRAPRPRSSQSLTKLLALGVLCTVGGWFGVWPRYSSIEQQLQADLEKVSRALDLGDHVHAQQIVGRLNQQYPGRPELELGQEVAALYQAGEPGDAQSFYDDVERLQQRGLLLAGLFVGHLHTARANRLLFEMHWSDAKQAYRQALAARPQLVAAQMGLGLLELWQSHPGQALMWFSRAEILAPHSPQIQVALGATQMQLRNFSRALKHYGTAIQRDPNYIAAHLELARAERLSGRPEKALRVLQLLDESWVDHAAQPRNQSPLGYRVSAEVARIARLEDPPVLFLRGGAQLEYYFRLSIALSACQSSNPLLQQTSLGKAKRLIELGLERGRALRARLVLLDELDEGNKKCLAAIEQAQLEAPQHSSP